MPKLKVSEVSEVSEADKVRERFCRYHCSSCDRHFTSLGAFDRHRTGEWDGRRCSAPKIVNQMARQRAEEEGRPVRNRLRVATRTGVCRLGKGRKEGVVVWETP